MGTSRASAEVVSVQRWGLGVRRRPCDAGDAGPLCPSKRADVARAASALPTGPRGRGGGLASQPSAPGCGAAQPRVAPGRDAPGAVEAAAPRPCPPPAGWPLPLWTADSRLSASSLGSPGSGVFSSSARSEAPPPGSRPCVALCFRHGFPWALPPPLTTPQSSSLPGPDPLSCPLSAGSPWTPRPSWC